MNKNCKIRSGLRFAWQLAIVASALPFLLGGAFAQSAVAGWSYVARHVTIRTGMIISIVISFFGFAATSLLPVFAKDILHVGPRGLGWLMAAPSIGAMIVTIPLARKPMQRAGRALLWAVAGFMLRDFAIED